MVQRGVNLRAVQMLAGHKSFATTERYAHLSPKHLREAVEALVDKETPEPAGAKPKAEKASKRRQK